MIRRVAAILLALCFAGAATAQTSDIAGALEDLNATLDILLGSPNNSDVPAGNPDMVVALSATSGLWSADGKALQNNTLPLPIDTLIALEVTATDLLYEMEFPLLGLQFVAIPGRIETVFIKFNSVGSFHGVCPSTCGSAGAPLIFDVHDNSR